MADIKNYNDEIQEMFLQFLISDSDLLSRSLSIIKSEYFNQKYRDVVDFLINHITEYNTVPKLEQISAVSGIKLDILNNISIDHQKWFLDEFETFCRHKALERAILESTDLLEDQDYGSVENKIKEATQVGLVRDLGLDYFADPKKRLEAMLDQEGAISIGWQSIDFKLYGGLNRGEVTIFCGGSGTGKSIFLQNIALNWALIGFNVVYVSMELSEKLVSMRMDAMLSGMGTKEIRHNVDTVALKIQNKGHKAGKLRVKQMPNNVNINDIKAFLREYEIQSGERIDAILIDHLDLMMPISNKISGADLYIKDKYITEEIRNLAVERHILCVTASQLNRASIEAEEYDHSHIAGGLTKIQTADNVIGIRTSTSLRENGYYQVQFMKTRSSSGVGAKVDLKFDPNTMRITDLDEDDMSATDANTESILANLKRGGSIKTDETSAEADKDRMLKMHSFLQKNE